MTTRTALALVFLLAGLALSGCGLSPVYGTYANGGANSAVATQMDTVYIASIPNRTGQKLRNLLIDRFYKTGRVTRSDAAWTLDLSPVGETIYGLGIAKDATATRSQIKLTTTLVLRRAGTKDPVLTRTLTAVSSFNTLASQYTTLVTEEDARDQVIRDLADQVATQVELYFSNPAAFPLPPAAQDAAPVAEKRETLF